jgi:hypothetical protein
MRLPMVSIIDNPKSNYFKISTSALKVKKIKVDKEFITIIM